ncbi:trypsin-like peptidase domain-containing protein [Thiobacter aerophilum]|uniref:Trypsin-like peptidase domain-containing protein n=1 Tax=Thiobacter aerophilum TaxID=3121275 RepID=A0ABV0ECI0_9BURK
MKKLWLLFAQFTTLCVAALFVISVFRPELLRREAPPFAPAAPVARPAEPAPASYRLAAKKAMPAVVNIYTSKQVRPTPHPLLNDPLFRRFFGERFPSQPQRLASLGSGVIVDRRGYIITNHHVIESADAIEVLLADGRTAAAKIVGSDPETDLAVIRIDLPDLPTIEFGHADRLEVGDVVLAIGNPFGVGQTVTMGIVSALGRSHLGINTFEDFIQTDAPINPGNSGGALVDTNGALVGINSAIFSRTGGSLGIGFAIPETLAQQVMDQILAHGAVVRGWIGVSMRDLSPELAHNLGLPQVSGTLVVGVLRGGPADAAGVKPGDVLMRIDSKPLPNANAALATIAKLPPGRRVKATLLRQGREREVQIVIERRPPMPRATLEQDQP